MVDTRGVWEHFEGRRVRRMKFATELTGRGEATTKIPVAWMIFSHRLSRTELFSPDFPWLGTLAHRSSVGQTSRMYNPLQKCHPFSPSISGPMLFKVVTGQLILLSGKGQNGGRSKKVVRMHGKHQDIQRKRILPLINPPYEWLHWLLLFLSFFLCLCPSIRVCGPLQLALW